ncbi:hypothetical protein JYU34_007273 [Plutella xylostella]|uniref:Uncharacterized protein n=1 Tax=Plutella xylostella TaxID=51655 RepID=A0ABQ7QQ48_PLUXY|nr:hypothetical protein JYU34_007273 [Plutella xylostella]
MPSAAAQRPPLAIRIDPRFIAPAGPRISNVYQPPPPTPPSPLPPRSTTSPSRCSETESR